jgi:hypothetical protein
MWPLVKLTHAFACRSIAMEFTLLAGIASPGQFTVPIIVNIKCAGSNAYMTLVSVTT